MKTAKEMMIATATILYFGMVLGAGVAAGFLGFLGFAAMI